MDLDDVAAADIDQKTKSDQYRGILEQAVSQGDAAACRRFVDHGAMLERLLSGALRFTSPPPPRRSTRLQCCPMPSPSCSVGSCCWHFHNAYNNWRLTSSKKSPRSEWMG
jgi:hypothetical protein